MSDALARGREAFERSAWEDAFTQLSAADGQDPLGPEDLDRLAQAAYLTGRDTDSVEGWARAHQEFLGRDEPTRAARCAFWAGTSLMLRGEMAPGSGWFARTQAALADHGHDCAERGYMAIPAGLHSLEEGDATAAYAAFEQGAECAERFGDRDLMALCRLGRGQALIHLGRTAEAVAMLDEAMVAVTSGEVTPIPAGIIYCAVILACQEIFDLRRAKEWTDALGRWCDTQPDLVPYRGQCLVHRSELMQMHGAWPDALAEAQRACDRLSDPPRAAVGMAWYQRGELRRLRGEFALAEEAYREAAHWGREPHPGLALLRLVQGRVEGARSAMRRVLDESDDRVTRSKMLASYVEIAIAAGDVQAARGASDELSQIASDVDAPLLYATSAHAQGAVLLAEGDPRAALEPLRRAWSTWQQLEAPYEAARVRVLVGIAYRKLGDDDTAEMELDAARWAFHRLGAMPDLTRVEELIRKAKPGPSGGLTAREVEVLGLVAAGKTNRSIADDLVISEKTVARHLSNIFTKIGVSSRAGATAYAYEHELVGGPPQ